MRKQNSLVQSSVEKRIRIVQLRGREGGREKGEISVVLSYIHIKKDIKVVRRANRDYYFALLSYIDSFLLIDSFLKDDRQIKGESMSPDEKIKIYKKLLFGFIY